LSDPTKSASFASNAGGGTEQGIALYKEMYRAINLENGAAYWDVLGLQLYGHPRQIWFGIKFAY
jgi:hypothetical protein